MTVSILVPAETRRLTTLENVRADLGLAAGSPSNEQLERFVDQASARAASYCRRTFGRETVRERLDYRSWTLDAEFSGLRLDRGPIASVASVTIDGVAIAVGGYEFAGSWLYLTDGTVRAPWYGRSASVDYDAGWILPDDDDYANESVEGERLPADVERAVIQLVGASVSAANRDAMIKSETVEGIGRTDFHVQGAGAALPHPEAEATLAQYRRHLFA